MRRTITGGEFSWPTVLGPVTSGENISEDAARWAMSQVMSGVATPAQIAAFGVSLTMKGVSGTELAALGATMTDFSTTSSADKNCLDVVGTGGDKAGTVNISTMTAIVAAACGAPVAKHGNRAASSKSGGADVLEALGVGLDLPPEHTDLCLREVGISFYFAPLFHPALRFAAVPRREIGVPTVFNMLGPLANPVQPKYNLIGCAFKDLHITMAEAFSIRGDSATVVRGSDGLDEITATGPTAVIRVHEGDRVSETIEPGDLDFPTCTLDELRGGTAEHNAQVARSLFAGQTGPVRTAVVMNAAAALSAFEHPQLDRPLGELMSERRARVEEALDTGAAGELLDAWVKFTRG